MYLYTGSVLYLLGLEFRQYASSALFYHLLCSERVHRFTEERSVRWLADSDWFTGRGAGSHGVDGETHLTGMFNSHSPLDWGAGICKIITVNFEQTARIWMYKLHWRNSKSRCVIIESNKLLPFIYFSLHMTWRCNFTTTFSEINSKDKAQIIGRKIFGLNFYKINTIHNSKLKKKCQLKIRFMIFLPWIRP